MTSKTYPLIEKPSLIFLEEKGVAHWPTWEKEVSRFDYLYDETEECYFLEGEVVIETDSGKYPISPGDFVTFPVGLKCIWDIQKPVKKHYNFI